MVDYEEFAALSRSTDAEERGRAAHMTALALLAHHGPVDEVAALYAALCNFLEDPSVKVRAAMAYGLLHAERAPRPIMLALMHDSSIISRAVVQFSPVLVDADILPLVDGFDLETLLAVAERRTLGPRLARALIERGERPVTLRLLVRAEIAVPAEVLAALAQEQSDDALLRGALLARTDLPAPARLALVRVVAATLRAERLVAGAVVGRRVERLMRDGLDAALATIGEGADDAERQAFAAEAIEAGALSTRAMLHALVNGQVLFFAACCAALSDARPEKVFVILETGGRAALNALFERCGFDAALRNLLARIVAHARSVDLANDAAGRHYVVTAITEELIAEHEGDIPEALAEAFAYLGEQNVRLARLAARGVMAGFTGTALPAPDVRIALPAA